MYLEMYQTYFEMIFLGKRENFGEFVENGREGNIYLKLIDVNYEQVCTPLRTGNKRKFTYQFCILFFFSLLPKLVKTSLYSLQMASNFFTFFFILQVEEKTKG